LVAVELPPYDGHARLAWRSFTRVSGCIFHCKPVRDAYDECRPSFSADWGDYISFASHLRAKADSTGADLLLIDTGDRIEGNGLYDGSNPKGKYLFDVYKHQQVDILCSGNHELYKINSSIDELHKTVPSFRDNYLASNLDIFDPETGKREPLAQRVRKFETKNQKLRVLAFGFLFDFTGNANNTVVQPVEETVKEEWFKEAIRDHDVDLIVVIGHVGIRMAEFNLLFKTIREEQWDTPIAFFGGHVHVRDYAQYDRKSAALASGRYMETVGFMSIDGIPARKEPKKDPKPEAASLTFSRRYIDNNLFSYHYHSKTNSSTFPTDLGKKVSSLIASARKTLQLGKIRGCAPQSLYVNRAPYPSNSSIFTWLTESVLPSELAKSPRVVEEKKIALVITNTGSVRFDIFEGPFTRDTEFLVSPFTSGFRFVPDVPLKVAVRVLELLNSKGPILSDAATLFGRQEWMLVPPEQLSGRAGLATARDEAFKSVQGAGAQLPIVHHNDDPENPDLRPGYTTTDDAGADGDDTLHSRVDFFAVPNCVQAAIGFVPGMGNHYNDVVSTEPVDLVYNEFVESWILLALQYLGQEVGEGDTRVYLEGKTASDVLTDWVGTNWRC
jgi:2',3'-cyclic-nucleotide 2'-phosphodiesterase (5'-nucleotidase family)